MTWLMDDNIKKGSGYERGLIAGGIFAVRDVAERNVITVTECMFLLFAFFFEENGQETWEASKVGKFLNVTTQRSHTIYSNLSGRGFVGRDSARVNFLTSQGKIIAKQVLRQARATAKDFSGS